MLTTLSDSDFLGLGNPIQNKMKDLVFTNKNITVEQIWRVCSDKSKTYNILKNMIYPLIISEHYKPYYINNDYGFLANSEIFINSGKVIMCHSTSGTRFDFAIIHTDKFIVEHFTKVFESIKQNSKLFVEIYNLETNKTDFMKRITEVEEVTSNRFMVKNGFTELLIPWDLKKKILHLEYSVENNTTARKINEELNFHRRRVESLTIKLKSYTCIDIAIKAGLENFINNGVLPGDDLSKDFSAELGSRADFIHNILSAMEANNNYEMVIVDTENSTINDLFCESNINLYNGNFWFVKVNSGVVFDFHFNGSPYFMIINEESIIKMFETYFNNFYNACKSMSFDKNKTIEYLQSKLQELNIKMAEEK